MSPIANAHGDHKAAAAGFAFVFQRTRRRSLALPAFFLVLLLSSYCAAIGSAQAPPADDVQPVPLLTGSVGFITTFDGGQAHLGPIVTPVVLVPLGERWLFETRATFESDLTQMPGRSGFHGQLQKNVDYAQLDFIANPYMTITLGRFLTPFNIFNERLYPVWIRNLQSDPLILPIGIGPSNASDGFMVRGGSKMHPAFDVNYALYFSARTGSAYIDSARVAGGRAGIVVPKTRLEFGGSFQRTLQDSRSNSFGFHAIWEPFVLPLELRAEYARSQQGSGYWSEAAYRLSQIRYLQREMRHTQLVARMQQAFPGASASSSFFPQSVRMFEAGINYYFIDGFKATSSYGRQFSDGGNKNVWTAGLTYRFVIPLESAGRE